jgi:hypothetical protein
VVGKLLTQGMIEEIPARGALPIWRRDEENGAVALRITRRGIAAIRAPRVSGDPGTRRAGQRADPRERIFLNRKPKCSGILLIGNRQTIDPGLEHVRWLKNHDAALGYRDLDSSLGISPNSLRFGAHEKPAK